MNFLYGSFRKLGVPYLGVLIIRTLLFRVLFLGSPIFGNSHIGPQKSRVVGSKVNPKSPTQGADDGHFDAAVRQRATELMGSDLQTLQRPSMFGV